MLSLACLCVRPFHKEQQAGSHLVLCRLVSLCNPMVATATQQIPYDVLLRSFADIACQESALC